MAAPPLRPAAPWRLLRPPAQAPDVSPAGPRARRLAGPSRRLLLPACLALAVAAGGAGALAALDRAFPPDLSRLAGAGAEVLDRNGRTLAMQPTPGGIWRLRTAASMLIAASIRAPCCEPPGSGRAPAGWYPAAPP